jgi:hypothetical protein
MANPHELEPQTQRQWLNYRRGLRHDLHAARDQCADWLLLETFWQKGKLIKRLGRNTPNAQTCPTEPQTHSPC